MENATEGEEGIIRMGVASGRKIAFFRASGRQTDGRGRNSERAKERDTDVDRHWKKIQSERAKPARRSSSARA